MEWWKWLIIAIAVIGALLIDPFAGILGAAAVFGYMSWK